MQRREDLSACVEHVELIATGFRQMETDLVLP